MALRLVMEEVAAMAQVIWTSRTNGIRGYVTVGIRRSDEVYTLGSIQTAWRSWEFPRWMGWEP